MNNRRGRHARRSVVRGKIVAMQSHAMFAAADVYVTARSLAAAPVCTGGTPASLQPAWRDTEIYPGRSMFAETLRVAREFVNPRKRRNAPWVHFDLVEGLDGEARSANFRARAGTIAESVTSWAALTADSLERLRDGIHDLLTALVVLHSQTLDGAGTHPPHVESVSRLALRSLSVAPGAPPVPARLLPYKGLAAAA